MNTYAGIQGCNNLQRRRVILNEAQCPPDVLMSIVAALAYACRRPTARSSCPPSPTWRRWSATRSAWSSRTVARGGNGVPPRPTGRQAPVHVNKCGGLDLRRAPRRHIPSSRHGEASGRPRACAGFVGIRHPADRGGEASRQGQASADDGAALAGQLRRSQRRAKGRSTAHQEPSTGCPRVPKPAPGPRQAHGPPARAAMTMGADTKTNIRKGAI